jgi:hypothetical protein|tara:strand:+ start:1101 stop:1298 length:198 start_codon:yes stop_codon:yes gene_type:complete
MFAFGILGAAVPLRRKLSATTNAATVPSGDTWASYNDGSSTEISGVNRFDNADAPVLDLRETEKP